MEDLVQSAFRATKESCLLTSLGYAFNYMANVQGKIAPKVERCFWSYVEYYRSTHDNNGLSGVKIIDWATKKSRTFTKKIFPLESKKIEQKYKADYNYTHIGDSCAELLSTIMLHWVCSEENGLLNNQSGKRGYDELVDFFQYCQKCDEFKDLLSDVTIKDCKTSLDKNYKSEVINCLADEDSVALVLYPSGNESHSVFVYRQGQQYTVRDPNELTIKDFDLPSAIVREYIIFSIPKQEISKKLNNKIMNIPFNKPHLTGKETEYIRHAVENGKLSGNGEYTKKCQKFFEERYGFKKCLLTTSGTDALEMCAMLCDLKPGDEVIIPSYTFVSTALAFLREGAKVVFADSMKRNPNIDAELLESLITPRTKVIVPVHYAGVACDMNRIMEIANRHNLLVVEDAAQAIDSYYKSPMTNYKSPMPLGSIGHFAAFSFHETKNITAGGEGGLLVVNDERFIRRAEILWEKGTNRAEFFRGAVNKYGWVDMGSSFLPAEINAAFLWAQLENLDEIQNKRKALWNKYYELLKPLSDKGYFSLPDIPEYASNNAHMFYLILPDLEKRTTLIQHLKDNGILAVFHYLSLHSSAYYQDKHDGRALPECDRYADTLVRLPMFYDLEIEDVERICSLIKAYCEA